MTPTGEQLYNSLEFWEKRLNDQQQYYDSLHNRYYNFKIDAYRYRELCESCNEVADVIKKRIKELKNAGAER